MKRCGFSRGSSISYLEPPQVAIVSMEAATKCYFFVFGNPVTPASATLWASGIWKMRRVLRWNRKMRPRMRLKFSDVPCFSGAGSWRDLVFGALCTPETARSRRPSKGRGAEFGGSLLPNSCKPPVGVPCFGLDPLLPLR